MKNSLTEQTMAVATAWGVRKDSFTKPSPTNGYAPFLKEELSYITFTFPYHSPGTGDEKLHSLRVEKDGTKICYFQKQNLEYRNQLDWVAVMVGGTISCKIATVKRTGIGSPSCTRTTGFWEVTDNALAYGIKAYGSKTVVNQGKLQFSPEKDTARNRVDGKEHLKRLMSFLRDMPSDTFPFSTEPDFKKALETFKAAAGVSSPAGGLTKSLVPSMSASQGVKKNELTAIA